MGSGTRPVQIQGNGGVFVLSGFELSTTIKNDKELHQFFLLYFRLLRDVTLWN